MSRPYFTMRRFSIPAVCMMFVFAVSLCVSSNASAQGQGQGQTQGGGPTLFSWNDNGYGTVSTTGSIQIGDEVVDCTPDVAGTIRFTGTEFEGCDGTAWVSLSAPVSSGAFACGVDQVRDDNGNAYNTVMIGTQCWMAENLNVGTRIDGTSNQTNNGAIEKYCYNDDPLICGAEGGLYQWNEMMGYSTTEGAQGICPPGWHIPTDTEWKTLEMALGMTQTEADSTGWRGTDQGNPA